MQTYEIIVAGRAVRANSADTTLVRTSVGIDKIHVLFDNAEWTSFPVRVTFANGETLVSTSVTLTALESNEWAAEAECTIPWEVIQDLGGIRITFQGTDSSGKHIITEASGTPLTVVEAGDVVDGSEPQPSPTIDEWNQAYADAMAAASDAASAAEQVSEILHSTDAQTLEELIEMLGSAVRYKGSVSTYADLPDDAEPGDTYDVQAAYGYYPAGADWTWTGTAWDALGGEMAIDEITPEHMANIADNPSAYLSDDLPDGATRLKYIVSNIDPQYLTAPSIDTGIACNSQGLRVEVRYDGDYLVDGFLFGDSSIAENATFAARHTAEGDIEFVSGGVEWSADGAAPLSSAHTVSLLSSGKGYVDGTEYDAEGTIGANPSATVKLCGTSESYDNGAKTLRGKLYSARIWVDGALVRDFVPAYADGEACLYDRISGDFFASTTTQAFESGPEAHAVLVVGQSGIAAAWIAANDGFAGKSTATTSTNGLMSSTDKAKLDGIDAQANRVTAGDGLTLESGEMTLGPLVGEGNPTRGCAIFGVEAEGWARQDSTVGKNLFDPAKVIALANAVVEQKPSGVRVRSSANGTYIATSTLCTNLGLVEGTQYTISSDVTVASGVGAITVRNTNNGIVVNSGNITASGKHSITFTYDPSVHHYISLFCTMTQSTAGDVTYSDLMLEAGSTATAYEPYSGGLPSPRPDWEQPIEVARGRNLLDESNLEIGYINSEGGISGTSNPSTTNRHSDYIPVDGGKDYTLSFALNNGTAFYSAWYDASKALISTFNLAAATPQVKTVTAPANARYIRVSFGQSAGQQAQLELGTTPTPYVPYGHVGLEVQGRNLLPPMTSTITRNGLTLTPNPDGSVTLNGTASAETHFEQDVTLPAGTYTASGISGISEASVDGLIQNENWEVIARFNRSGISPTFTLSGEQLIRYRIRVKVNITLSNSTFYPMLNAGTEATSYQPYTHTTTPVPLPAKGWAGGLPDGTADALSIDSAGRWEWENNADEAVLDGSETWGNPENNGKRISIELSNANAENAAPVASTSAAPSIKSSHFRAVSQDNGWVGTVGVSQLNNGSKFFFSTGSTIIMSDWLTWLQANPVTVLYPLAAPTTEHGYLDLPALPEGSTVDIKELSDVGISWWVKGAEALVEHAANMARRETEENESIEDALAELAARVAALES